MLKEDWDIEVGLAYLEKRGICHNAWIGKQEYR